VICVTSAVISLRNGNDGMMCGDSAERRVLLCALKGKAMGITSFIDLWKSKSYISNGFKPRQVKVAKILTVISGAFSEYA